MQKIIIALLSSAVLAGVALAGAPYKLAVYNKAGNGEVLIENYDTTRWCWCLSGTQTHSITAINGGLVRLFSSKDCTGNYETIGPNGSIQ